ncbi:MAG: hypothetical protein CMJ31_00735 [Phycisphaerae bacterium]|nr:hypothetical protein [Phycisphaerae bacterium]
MREPYALEPEPTAPDLPGGVIVRSAFEDLVEPLAAELYLHAGSCVRNFGDFHLACSVGPAQVAVVMRLMVDPAYRWLPWNRTHLWIVEDRVVPVDHPESSMRQLVELVSDHAGIPERQIHAPPTGEGAAATYERELQSTLAWREKGQDRLDYALLALDRDGGVGGAGVVGADGGDHLFRRFEAEAGPSIAATPELIRSSRLIAIVASGAEAASGVRLVVDGRSDAIARIRPVGGAMRWYVDGEACA